MYFEQVKDNCVKCEEKNLILIENRNKKVLEEHSNHLQAPLDFIDFAEFEEKEKSKEEKLPSLVFCPVCGNITSIINVVIYEDIEGVEKPQKGETELNVVFEVKNKHSQSEKIEDLYSVKQEYSNFVIDEDLAFQEILKVVNVNDLKLLLSEMNIEFRSLDELNTLLLMGDSEIIFSQDDATQDYIVILKENNDLSKSDYSSYSFERALSKLFLKTALLKEKHKIKEDCDQNELMSKLRELNGYVQNGTDSSLSFKYENGFYKLKNVSPYSKNPIWEYRDVSLVKLINKTYSMHKYDND